MADNRAIAPEECEACQQEDATLEYFRRYKDEGVWHCEFCAHFLDPDSTASRNLAAMGHILLKAIRGN